MKKSIQYLMEMENRNPNSMWNSSEIIGVLLELKESKTDKKQYIRIILNEISAYKDNLIILKNGQHIEVKETFMEIDKIIFNKG